VGFAVVNLDEIAPAGPGGAARLVRREPGVQAFGINWFEPSRGRSPTNTTSASSDRKRST
jgi:hypothetical protein